MNQEIINQLLTDVVKKFGRPPEQDNYETLSTLLYVSPSTLKKCFCPPRKGFVISHDTLNRLSRYVGYEDYDAYAATCRPNNLVFIIDGREYSYEESLRLLEGDTNPNHSCDDDDLGIFDIPEDVFSDKRDKTTSGFISLPLEQEVIEKGVENYRKLIEFLIRKTEYVNRENVEALLRVFNGYPYHDKPIICDGKALRTFVYVIKSIFVSKKHIPKYKPFFSNIQFKPLPNKKDSKDFIPLNDPVKIDPDCSKNIGKGTLVPNDDKVFLKHLYPKCFS